MQHEKSLNPDVAIANSQSRQRLSAEVQAKDAGQNAIDKLARERFFAERSVKGTVYSAKELPYRERAPWAFEITDEFSERISHGNVDSKVHVHIEFRTFERMRDARKNGDYIGGFISATLHLEAEPVFKRQQEKNLWVEEMRSSIIGNANGTVSRYTGVRNPHGQKGIIVEFGSNFGIEDAGQYGKETWNNGFTPVPKTEEETKKAEAEMWDKAYLPTERKKEEIREFLGLIERTINTHNGYVVHSNGREDGNLASLARK